MFTLVKFNHPAQRALCMMMSTLIVVASLSLAAYATEHAANVGYSVIVTQIQ